MDFLLAAALRLMLACLLGGVIGYEREQTHRPAGFRTHILVCVGSALVMVTSEYLFRKYSGIVNMDPARLGAQVISGIGFLGAGTIMREGFNVKGLTTAASLWTVCCVGLAAGSGYYEGAVLATLIVFLTLITLKRLENHFIRKSNFRILYIQVKNYPEAFGVISAAVNTYGAAIKSLEFVNNDTDSVRVMKLVVRITEKKDFLQLTEKLYELEGVQKVYEE